MTKRVRFKTQVGVRINETELKVLEVLSECEGVAVMSIGELSVALGCCAGSAHKSLRMLDDKGLISVHRRYLKNGGQLENEYELTDLGGRILQAAHD
ncbi:hypothetical protein [uncultured Parolsenella sp.]|uniref:hypothetical protein n=1 Tax=uncultured Parolsenella sp. TaxID=2083008 RepID=UPI0025D28E99|nr:hypothetical protein [uncultured Parolsenella sp.]